MQKLRLFKIPFSSNSETLRAFFKGAGLSAMLMIMVLIAPGWPPALMIFFVVLLVATVTFDLVFFRTVNVRQDPAREELISILTDAVGRLLYQTLPIQPEGEAYVTIGPAFRTPPSVIDDPSHATMGMVVLHVEYGEHGFPTGISSARRVDVVEGADIFQAGANQFLAVIPGDGGEGEE